MRRDEPLVDIETEKVTIEVVAPVDGVVEKVLKEAGAIIASGEIIGEVAARKLDDAAAPKDESSAKTPDTAPVGDTTGEASSGESTDAEAQSRSQKLVSMSPAVRKLAAELGVNLDEIVGGGRDGRILRADVLRAAKSSPAQTQETTQPQSTTEEGASRAQASAPPVGTQGDALVMKADDEQRPERRVPMSRLRASIARRLVEAQHNAAMLTTFNEIDMSEVMRLRDKYKQRFAESHQGVRMGLMSFFVRASVEALKRFPAVNASIDGTDIVYHGYYDIGVAVSTDAGLLVPVLRDADALGLAQIEAQIAEYSQRARENKLTLEELTGGTFTISNGGVFGSLLSTPILNPPQTAILGMHKIQARAQVIDGEIVARPMMYLALSYDHRLIDGREAVRFLVTIKDMVEDPARLLLEI